jgi:sulfur-oxidizing protein SoxY
MSLTRREVLTAGVAASAVAFLSPRGAHASDAAAEFVTQIAGRTATESDRVHLVMPEEFPTGYTVPLELSIDSPMTAADHVRYVRVFAPKNPIVEVVRFDFVPGRSIPHVSTRVRLAAPQDVIAVAEMSDGALLMATTWVAVATNGCA